MLTDYGQISLVYTCARFVLRKTVGCNKQNHQGKKNQNSGQTFHKIKTKVKINSYIFSTWYLQTVGNRLSLRCCQLPISATLRSGRQFLFFLFSGKGTVVFCSRPLVFPCFPQISLPDYKPVTFYKRIMTQVVQTRGPSPPIRYGVISVGTDESQDHGLCTGIMP